MSRRNLLFSHGDGRPAWASAIRIPSADAPDELMHTAQCVEILRPLLPLLAATTLIYSAYAALEAWPVTPLAGGWIALGLATGAAILLGRGVFAARLAGNPVLSAKATAACAIALGLLFGSANAIFPGGYAGELALGCMIVALAVFAPLPLAQFAFLASFAAAGLVFGTGPVPAFGLVPAAVLGLAAILRSAQVRFARAKARMQLQKARIAQQAESNGSFSWETDGDGRLVQASESMFKALGREAGELLHRPLWDLMEPLKSGARDADDDAASGAGVLRQHHASQAAFCDAQLRAPATDGIHYLSLSGQPRYDLKGTFAGFLGVGLNLTDYTKSQEQLLAAAERDALTKLMNRASFNQRLEELIGSSGNRRQATALMLIDLDKFKQANDLLGHQVGDNLLMQFAERLRNFIKTDGFVGRLGGDEFGVVVSAFAEKHRIDQLASELIKHLSMPYEISGQRVEIGATAGIAISPEHGDTVDALVRNADLALYSAKARGRGGHRFFDVTLLEHALERRRLEIDLAEAIEKGELSVMYQPIVDAASERLCGFEALARWHHRKRGEVAPDEFIPLAEVAGLMHRLGEWVLRESCMEAAQWPSDIRLAVNLSPTQLSNPGLSSIVINSLARSQLPPSRLELEITESVFLEETEGARNTLRQLHELGVNWTLDDFGTGYSSLKYLLKAPFTKIKIDREFINGLSVPESQKSSIVSTIVTLATNLGMVTTAEGVESLNDLRVARELGCTQIQGFVYGPKLTASEARSLARTRVPVPAQGFEATRREPRMIVLRSADIVCNGEIRPGTVRNVSSNGAMLEVEWDIPVGTRIEVHMDHEGARGGVVRWVEGIRIGVQFDGDIPVALPLVRAGRSNRPASRASAA
jgi:diguanylate cyclase (GGDEF)-like protein